MPVITADRLERIRNIILQKVLPHFPEARYITDTQIVLDSASGAVMNLDNLLRIIESNDESFEDEIISDYARTMAPMMAAGAAGHFPLDRRTILGSVTKMIYPAGSMPAYADPIALTNSLEYVYALHENDVIQAHPLSRLMEFVSREELDAAAHAKLRAYARGVRVIREMGGVILDGRKQTPSIAFCIEDCAKALKLPKCELGWFVAVPARNILVILPASDPAMILPLAELCAGTNMDHPAPMTPSIFYVQNGQFHELLGAAGPDIPRELLDLHGPFESWPVAEGYWEGSYSGNLG
ncbi:hypothetical protein [Corynebacterium sp. A21]|uniref:hypothetical protein n=1 Tax=Corynebacterium sp. A21 TaxID=3457318 RepID=UPI003FD6A0B2